MKALNELQKTVILYETDKNLQTKLCLYVTDNIKPREKISNAKAGIKDHREICSAVSISPSLDEHIDG